MNRDLTLPRLLLYLLCLIPIEGRTDDQKPNILFIAVDDLNDWIECLGGNSQTVTPNFDRLAESGVLFTNAHCPAAACNPSRTAVMTGIAPNRSGLYSNEQKMREILPDADILPQHFRRHGYRASGSGKILHYFIDAPSWDEYFPEKESENPFPQTFNPSDRPVSLPRGGAWQYVETDWAALDLSDEEYGGDWEVTRWVGESLGKQHDEPFFLACGIYRPHEPWFVPEQYYEPFPIDSIELPAGYREDDLDDLPPAGKAAGPNRYFPHIREQGQWKHGIQGYLASIHYADAMLGRVLDALEAGPNRDNTIVVLWSDHGWHLGEKQHWQKFTAWRACTRVPLMIRVPEGASQELPEGTTGGQLCDRPVDLLSLFPTLTELAGIPSSENGVAPSLLPLLSDADAEWDHVAITYLSAPGSYGLSTDGWRYIHYQNGDEELYDIQSDPYEWTNLATDPRHAAKLSELRKLAPVEFAEKIAPSVKGLEALTWQPATGNTVPPSRPDGATFAITLVNHRKETVELFWVDRDGGSKSYGVIAPGKTRDQSTRPGAVWRIDRVEDGGTLGYFAVGDRRARAEIPEDGPSGN